MSVRKKYDKAFRTGAAATGVCGMWYVVDGGIAPLLAAFGVVVVSLFVTPRVV